MGKEFKRLKNEDFVESDSYFIYEDQIKELNAYQMAFEILRGCNYITKQEVWNRCQRLINEARES